MSMTTESLDEWFHGVDAAADDRRSSLTIRPRHTVEAYGQAGHTRPYAAAKNNESFRSAASMKQCRANFDAPTRGRPAQRSSPKACSRAPRTDPSATFARGRGRALRAPGEDDACARSRRCAAREGPSFVPMWDCRAALATRPHMRATTLTERRPQRIDHPRARAQHPHARTP